MIDISAWMKEFVTALDNTFGQRVRFVGLQGSYGRGEATDSSDIDPVVILNRVTAGDVQTYAAMLDTLPHRELICGFFSGREEILSWDTADLFQFFHDTVPVRGSLEELLPPLDDTAARRAVKMAVCNIYHGCVHNMLHGKREKTLRGLYKSASFAVQAICYLQTGSYYRHQAELLEAAAPEERKILETFAYLKNSGEVRFEEMSEALMCWSGKWIRDDEMRIAGAYSTKEGNLVDGIIHEIVRGKNPAYNTVYFYGEPEAVEEVLRKIEALFGRVYPDKRLCRCEGRGFADAITDALLHGKEIRFLAPHVGGDLFVVRDIDEIGGREYAMERMYGIVDHYLERGCRIVATGRVPVREMCAMEDRIKAQLEGGLCFCLDRDTAE